MAESLQKFLKGNGIKPRKITPLWPQANAEIERQNLSLLKRVQIAQVEREDWKKAVLVLTYLVPYRNTDHPSTGMCPAELLFQRKLRTKLPELREVAELGEDVRDRDRDKKRKMKEHADRARKGEENSFCGGI